MHKQGVPKREIIGIDPTVSSAPAIFEEENEMKILTEKLADRQNNIINAIIKEDDVPSENRQVKQNLIQFLVQFAYFTKLNTLRFLHRI